LGQRWLAEKRLSRVKYCPRSLQSFISVELKRRINGRWDVGVGKSPAIWDLGTCEIGFAGIRSLLKFVVRGAWVNENCLGLGPPLDTVL